jgi:hypothetical protein
MRSTCARFASLTGDFALPVVLAVLVLGPLHGTAAGLGLVLGAHVAGSFLFRVVGHAWTAHQNARRVAIVASLGCAAIQAAVLGLFLTNTLAVPVLAGLMLWRGLAAALRPAGGSALALVPAVVLGPLVGLALVNAAGIAGALAVEIALHLIGTTNRTGTIRTAIRADFRALVSRPRLLWPVAVNLCCAGPLLTLAAVGTTSYAVVLSAVGLGAVVGGLFRGYRRMPALLCLIPAAVGPLVLGLHTPVVLTALAFVVVGAVQSVHEVRWSETVRDVPRSAAAEELASLAVLPIGQVLGGLAVDRWGVPITAWAVVAGLCALPLLGGVPPPRPRTRPDRADIRTGSPASAASR